MRKILLQISIGIFSVLLFNACVEVQDILAPVISLEPENPFKETYYYGDSIKFQVSFQDNSSIIKSEVAITKFGSDITDTVSSWGIYRTEDDTLKGSRFVSRTIAEEVPTVFNSAYLATGLYIAYLSVEDRGGTIITLQDTFRIESDITPPVASGITIGLPEITAGEYEACPGLRIPVSGLFTDNTQIKRLRYKVGSRASISFDRTGGSMQDDEVDLATFFDGNQSLRLPSDFPAQGSETVSIFALDVFNNTTQFDFIITSNCDLEVPEVQIVSTEPDLDADNFTTVVSGQQFTINTDGLLVTDNGELDKVEIYFREGSADDALLYSSLNINASSISLGDFNFPSASGLFSDSDIGKDFTITIKAFDKDGNQSEDAIIELAIERDDAPEIPTLDFIINQNGPKDTTFTNVTSGVSYILTTIADEALAIDPTFVNFMLPEGKAEDDVGIETVLMTWVGPAGINESVLVGGTSGIPFEGGEINPKVIQFSDYVDNSTFVFDNTSTISTPYQLTITITDTKGQLLTISYNLIR